MQQRQGVGGGGGQGVESVSVFQSKSFEKCRCQREAGEGMMDIMAAIITSTERRACGGRPPSKSRSRARIKSSSGTERGGAEAPFPSLFPSCGLLPNDTTTMQARFPFLLPHIHPPLLLAPECRRHYYTLSPTQPTMCPKIMNRMLSEDGELQKDVELISFQVTQIIPLSPSIYPPPPPVRLLGGEARSTSQAHMGDISSSNGNGSGLLGDGRRKSCWYEEEIEQNLRWCFALNSILHTGSSQYQDIALLDTKPFGKALVLDGKLQSAEMDEFIYHESLVHPPLLHHHSPKHIFIMGGGEGSTAREVLRHRTVERVVMCDIDQEVVDFCKSHLVANKEAFFDPRLHVIINDAGAELEKRKDKFDVIVGDLADPIEGGPCYKLYTKSFYEETLKPRLNQGGIFVTQAGPAGVFSHTEVFSCIYNTLRHVFRYVVPYSAHIPSYADTWGWVMASDSPFTLDAEKLDSRIRQRIEGENRYVDGKTFASASILSKAVRKSLAKETQLYTEGTAKFIYGHGNCTNVAST